MSMTLAFVGGNFAVVAADTRTSFYLEGDRRISVRVDGSDKLRRVGPGFVASTGDQVVAQTAMAALGRLGDTPTLEAVRATLRQSFEATAPRVRARFAGADPERTAFVWGFAEDRGPAAVVLGADGEHFAGGRSGFLSVTLPPGIEPLGERARIGRELQAAETLPQLLEAVRRAFARIAAADPSLSGEVQAGMIYWRGPGDSRCQEFRGTHQAGERGSGGFPAVAEVTAVEGDLGTVTAGTIEANVIVASDSFTASEAVFTGELAVEGSEGSNLFEVRGSPIGEVLFKNQGGTIRLSIDMIGLGSYGAINAPSGDLRLLATGGDIDIRKLTVTGKSASSNYVPVKVNGTLYYLRLYT